MVFSGLAMVDKMAVVVKQLSELEDEMSSFNEQEQDFLSDEKIQVAEFKRRIKQIYVSMLSELEQMGV